MKKQLYCLILATCVAMLSCSCYIILGEGPKTEEEKAELERDIAMARMQASVNAKSKFDISGTVVDVDGNPVKDVTMSTSFVRLGSGFREDFSRSEKKLKNGKFSISKRGYKGLTITFRKQGYYQAKYAFNTHSREPYDSRIAPYQKDLKILLREIGEPVNLKNTSASMDWHADGNHDIIDLDTFARMKLNDIKDKNDISYVVIDIAESSDVNNNAQDGDKPKLPILALKIILDDPEAGFIVDANATDYGDMKEAPGSGYAKELLLDFSLYHKAPPKDRTWFYYRNNGTYGKGYISYNGQNQENAYVYVYLQKNMETDPDKKRNVTTEDPGYYGAENYRLPIIEEPEK